MLFFKYLPKVLNNIDKQIFYNLNMKKNPSVLLYQNAITKWLFFNIQNFVPFYKWSQLKIKKINVKVDHTTKMLKIS